MDSPRIPDSPGSRIKKLIELSDINLKHGIAAQRYFNMGDQIIRQADKYYEHGELEQAFVLYFKYSSLFAEKIQTHPLYNTVSKETRKHTFQQLKYALNKSEELKPILVRKYEAECKEYLQNQEKLLQFKNDTEEKKDEYEVKSIKLDVSPGILNTTTETNLVHPVSYLPENLVVYEIPPEDEQVEQAGPNNGEMLPAKPIVDRNTKPLDIFGSKLRSVHIPAQTTYQFLNLAKENTFNNKETCGILAGKMGYNKLVITHLLIPKQSGSSDSCTTYNEEDLFLFQDKHELITIGWIHTHPNQTAFLSSVDLHTHYAYQLMIAEAIAIVCAPKFSDIGFFHLTPDYGLEFIGNCQQSGFHPHPSEPRLFQDAEHCAIIENGSLQVVDMR